MLEEPADGEREATFIPDPVGDPHGQQRVTAEIEEVIVDTDLVEAEYIGPDVREGGLRTAAGRVGRCGGHLRDVALAGNLIRPGGSRCIGLPEI
ncbi:hypothetical protein NQU54_44365 [Streptomyces samsunensis]|uniref:Uncharacterized protein n=1 Tax=Streptomyces malaysiensis subsp. samsunensis TaxID=459658 RepID=A0A9X2M659_STRMQ|nr:hypothetical protein [Streptomyces samsunensis]MCQ8835869.1 hypothetical protein [Streptomyces samsunensis]